MCSYNKVNGEYASQNRWLLTDVLRNEWGFEGYVMSDWGAVSDRVKGVHAGLDLEMPASGGTNDARVVAAVREGRLDEKDVDTCVRRILTIVDRYLKNRKPETEWDKEKQHALARDLAAECMVLLKNEDAVLPFAKEEKVAVIGQFAKKPRYQGGGSSHINSFKVESLLDALEGMSGITYAQGYGIVGEEPDEALIAEAVEAAKAADKAVIVAGLPDSFESEGYDRTHMRMPKCQNELICRVAAANPNTVVVLYNGSPVEMPWADCVKGIIEAYLGGQAVGGATKAVLYGEKNPCGRLPESFPYQLEDNPSFLSYGGEGNTAVYNEGVFVGYRYYDKKKMAVRYPFGYGLSYTTFAYSNLCVSAKSMDDTEKVKVTVDVTNTGNRAGKEVVQLYVRNAPASVFRPVRELKGIEKVELAPGETKTVSFTLCKRAFAYWHAQLQDWMVETGTFGIEIARSSRDIVLCEDIEVRGTKALPQEPVSPDSIMMDLEKNPAAMAGLQPLLTAVQQALGMGGNEEKSEAASEAVTEDMGKAMMAYMPLRGLASFGNGAISYDQLKAMCDQINAQK